MLETHNGQYSTGCGTIAELAPLSLVYDSRMVDTMIFLRIIFQERETLWFPKVDKHAIPTIGEKSEPCVPVRFHKYRYQNIIVYYFEENTAN